MLERADRKASTSQRKITLRGRPLNVDDPDPKAIARALKKAKHNAREAKQRAMESKVVRL